MEIIHHTKSEWADGAALFVTTMCKVPDGTLHIVNGPLIASYDVINGSVGGTSSFSEMKNEDVSSSIDVWLFRPTSIDESGAASYELF